MYISFQDTGLIPVLNRNKRNNVIIQVKSEFYREMGLPREFLGAPFHTPAPKAHENPLAFDAWIKKGAVLAAAFLEPRAGM
jgi:hypothetical protein